MKTSFITFKDTMINVADISWSRVSAEKTFYDGDKPWTMTVGFKGVTSFLWFNFKTQRLAQEAHMYFNNLVFEALDKE